MPIHLPISKSLTNLLLIRLFRFLAQFVLSEPVHRMFSICQQAFLSGVATKRIDGTRAMKRIKSIGSGFPILTGCIFSLFTSPTVSALEIRQIDGTGNNLTYPIHGEAGSQLLRLLPAAYEDGLSEPRGGAGASTLPGARAVSNALSAQTGSVPAAAGVSSWFWQWGQFIDHDLDLTGPASPAEPFNIAVPTGDNFFDPGSDGNKEIRLDRSVFTLDSTGTRQQLNEITAFIDGSVVYGSDPVRAADLRSNDGSGKLRTSTAANGEILLPFNTSNLSNATAGTGAASDFFIAGDVRANEQIGLTATHTLFMREHNRLADELKTRLDTLDPSLVSMRDSAISTPGNGIDDEGDFIYEAARKVVGAQIQKITYEEFVPVLLGPGALPTFTGYDESIDPGISNAFSTAAFRVGHTMLPGDLLRSHDLSGTGATSIALRDAFFNPQEVVTDGVDSLLTGMLVQPAQEVDTRIVDDVRNFLFGLPGAGGFDLASLNIQRGREHGLPAYNDYRELFGLGRAIEFTDITGGDASLAALFDSIYNGDIDAVDLWIGGLAEQHVNGGLVGETFWYILADQFARLRDGDRFTFLIDDIMDELTVIDPGFEEHTRLNYLIERNTHYVGMPDSMFMLPTGVPEPETLMLLLVGLAALGFSRYRPAGKPPGKSPEWLESPACVS